MTSYYDVYCEGCETEQMIEVEGYIGIIENFWCNDCGYDGEFMSDTTEEKYDIIAENLNLMPIDEIRYLCEKSANWLSGNNHRLLNNMMRMYLNSDDPEVRFQFHKSMDTVIKSLRK